MRFLIAVKRKKGTQKPVQFRYVNVDRKGQMSEPYEICAADLSVALEQGEDIHLLLKTGCTWNVGAKISAGESFAGLPEF